MQFKAMIATNPLYTQEQRTAAVKLLESIDADIEIAGPYEPSDVTEELLEVFNKALCEDDSDEYIPVVPENDDEDDAGTRKGDLLEGHDDSDKSGR